MLSTPSTLVPCPGPGQLPISGEVYSLLQLPGSACKVLALTVNDEYCLAQVDAQLKLDSCFADGGYLVDSFTEDGSGFSGATGVSLREGKLLVIGGLFDFQTFTDHLALARYHMDGRIDPSFGISGKAIIALPRAHQRRMASRAQAAPGVRICRDPVQQDDGKVLVFFDEVSSDYFRGRATLIRLTAEGQLDHTFNGSGFKRVSYQGGEVYPKGVWLQHDQKILAYGGTHIGSDGTSTALIMRLHPDGSPDASFNEGGVVALGTQGVESLFSALCVDRSGHTVAIGTDDGNLLMVRLLADGQTDPDFNGGEALLLDFEFTIESLPGLQAQGDALILAGTCLLPGSRNRRGLVLRLLADGTLDRSFAEGAGYRISRQVSEYTSLLIEGDGQIVVAGYSYAPDFAACIERLGVDG